MKRPLFDDVLRLARELFGATCEVELYSRDNKAWGARTVRSAEVKVHGQLPVADVDSKATFASTFLALVELERLMRERAQAYERWIDL